MGPILSLCVPNRKAAENSLATSRWWAAGTAGLSGDTSCRHWARRSHPERCPGSRAAAGRVDACGGVAFEWATRLTAFMRTLFANLRLFCTYAKCVKWIHTNAFQKKMETTPKHDLEKACCIPSMGFLKPEGTRPLGGSSRSAPFSSRAGLRHPPRGIR